MDFISILSKLGVSRAFKILRKGGFLIMIAVSACEK